MIKTKLALWVAAACITLNAAAAQQGNFQGREDREPEAKTGYSEKQAVVAEEFMVVAANPYASWAGRRVIEKGGSAIDAAIAIQAMLTLVEPQSSGIGGGAFILYWDDEEKKLHTYDGREMAPAKVDQYLFTEQGKPMKWRDAVVGGKSVGVPGAIKALELAHQEFGQLEWQTLFTDTIETATKGFTVSPRLHKLLALDIHPGLRAFPASKNYFFPAGQPLQAGDNKKNPALAKTLTGLATQGADYFYLGDLPKKIEKAVQTVSINPGLLTADDFAAYTAIKRAPICGAYRNKQVCGMAPPSSGGINVLQILKQLDQFNIAEMGPNSANFAHVYTQSTAMAYADRNQFVADTDFTKLPYAALINDTYLTRRADNIAPNSNMRKFSAGQPYTNAQLGIDQSIEAPNTSHISIVDKQGNAVSMTTSIEFMFGSGLMVDGFLLNNQLTDFSLAPSVNGRPILNRVEPGKRPRSAMSPTVMFDEDGELELVVGSPGGSRIISYVAQTIIGVVDWQMDVQQAINLPKITNRNDYTALEKGTPVEGIAEQLTSKGHNVRLVDLNSGLHGIQIVDGKLVGGADPRREGVAVGN